MGHIKAAARGEGEHRGPEEVQGRRKTCVTLLITLERTVYFLGALFFQLYPGDVLLSHAVARIVPSPLRGLASVFGMGTGVSPSLWSPGNLTFFVPPRSACMERTASGTFLRTF